MNEMIDPLLQAASNDMWPAPKLESAIPFEPQPRVKVVSTGPTDRRQMLQELKARQAANVAVSEQPVNENARVPKRSKKKAPRPARAAKIFVFGLSTTAMFGAVSGYALADLQKKQHSIPPAPVNAPVQAATTPAPSSVTGEVATQTPASSNPPQKTSRSKTNVAVAPAVDSPPVDQTPAQAAPADPNVVIDVPVPQAAQPGQGQTSGGSQQSSGSH